MAAVRVHGSTTRIGCGDRLPHKPHATDTAGSMASQERKAPTAFLARPRSLVEISDAGDLLGMDVLFEPQHQWIAEEYLATDVPHGWAACIDADSDRVYYWNESTQVRVALARCVLVCRLRALIDLLRACACATRLLHPANCCCTRLTAARRTGDALGEPGRITLCRAVPNAAAQWRGQRRGHLPARVAGRSARA